MVESGTFVVIKGTETTGTAEDPVLTQADLLSDNATKDQMALWRVAVSGTVISAPVRLFDVRYPNDQAMHGIVTAGSGTEYTVNVEGIKALSVGESFVMIPHVDSASTAPTLNVNGLGAFAIRRRISGQAKLTTAGADSDWLAAGVPVRLTFNGTYWLTDNVKPSVSDLYGTLSIAGGGTGADNLADAQKKLQIYPAVPHSTYGRCYYRDAPGRQEWINPPMFIDTEYCTTEWFMGVPVFTKILAVSRPEANLSATATIAFGVMGLLRISAYCSGVVGQLSSEYMTATISSTILRANVTNKNGALTGNNVLVQAWYIKDKVGIE